MRRHTGRGPTWRALALSIGLTISIAATISPAWAQYYGGGYSDPTGSAVGERMLELAIALALGFAIGAFFSPLLKPFRRIVWAIAAISAVLFAILGPSPAADVAGWPVKLISFLVALGFGLRLGLKIAREIAARNRPTSFGSAKWATFDYLMQRGLFQNTGFLLGEFLHNTQRAALCYEGARHLLTVAPTRSGKGVSSIIPNLLTYGGSALVVDPKGENALITAARRGAGLEQKIMLVDPWDIAACRLNLKPSCFNPLDWIIAGDPDAVENAFLLADALVVPQGGGESRFWDDEAKALLTGIILYVATAAEEAGHRTLARVRDILTLDTESQNDIWRKMYAHPNPVVSTTGARTAAKDDRLFSNVMASAQSHTHFLDSPRIRESLSRSDFSFEALKSSPMTIYLILPADRLKTFDRWLRLLIQQAITVNARNIDVKPKKPVLFLLDEMPSLGRLESVEQAYGLMAGFGMQLWGIAQDLSQLAKIYGEHGWQTFVSNSGVIQYFGSRDKMTAEYFSSLCGVTTVEVHNFSWAVGKAISWATSFSHTFSHNSSSTTSGHSTTESRSWTRTTGSSEAQRQLAYPDELMVLKGNQQVIFVENLDPIMGEKIIWYKDEALKQLGTDLQRLAAPPPKPKPALVLTPELEAPTPESVIVMKPARKPRAPKAKPKVDPNFDAPPA